MAPQAADLNLPEHLWDVVKREIQIIDAIMSIWIQISEKCFQHFAESMSGRIKATLKPKGVLASCT